MTDNDNDDYDVEHLLTKYWAGMLLIFIGFLGMQQGEDNAQIVLLCGIAVLGFQYMNDQESEEGEGEGEEEEEGEG